jgi:hypothetical protein
MPAEQELRYCVALQKLKTRASNMNGPFLFNESTLQKKPLLELISAVEKSEKKQPYSHLTEALDSTNDLLDRRITSERYRQVTDCMLSETHGDGKLSIAFMSLKGSTFVTAVLSYAYYAAVSASFSALALCLFMLPLWSALDALQTEFQVPKGVQPNALVDGMRSFLANWVSSEPVNLSDAANDASTAATETTASVSLSMV